MKKYLAAMALFASVFLSVPANADNYQIWFAPTLRKIRNNGTIIGSVDFNDLFKPEAPWPRTIADVSVFKTYQSYITFASISELRKMFDFLRTNHIMFALEFGPMNRSPDGCGAGVEGFAAGGAKSGKALSEKIRQAGGTLDYVAMDEPFWNGYITHPPNACNMSPTDMAINAGNTVAAARAIFPKVKFGDIEPVQQVPGHNLVEDYSKWIDAWRATTGAPLAFFHLDVLWKNDVEVRISTIAKMLAAHQVPFGLIYNGDFNDKTDESWFSHAEKRFKSYEKDGRPLPQQVIFQSWNVRPSHVLPETKDNTHTNLILKYVAHRPGVQKGEDDSN